MKKVAIATCASIILITSFSCKKILNQKPETQIENEHAINTVKDLETVLYGAYDGLQGSNVLGGNMTVYSDFFADDAELTTLNKLSGFGTSEIYNGNTSVQIGALRSMWSDCYSTINKANNVITFIDNNTKLSGAEYELKKDRLKAEAIFIRAVVHYELLRFWALPYDKTKAGSNTQLGVVIRNKPTVSIDSLSTYKKPRASVEEVYDFVINDLKKADELFLQHGVNNAVGYASSMACKAMLARVYYYKGDDINAAIYAQTVIDSKNYTLKDTTYIVSNFRNQGTYKYAKTNENIFEVINTASDNSSSLRGYYSRLTDYWFRMPKTTVEAVFADSTDFKRLMLMNVTEQPHSHIISGSGFSAKYDTPNGFSGGYNIPYLRLAEMYLTLAECKTNTGDMATALANYNIVRKRSFRNYVDETSTENLLAKIQDERRRELCFEGDRYMFIRKNAMPLRLNSNGVDYKKFLFKIPQEEIAGNRDIIQNE